MGKEKFSSDKIISYSAIFIAIVSIIVAVWQGVELRKHNRLSVKPLLNISYAINYDKNFVELTLKNNGLGPAIIDNSIAIVGNEEYTLNNHNNFMQFLNKLGIDKVPLTFDILDLGSTLIPNESWNIFVVDINSLEKLGLDPLSLMNEVIVTIKYNSLYDENFTTNLKKNRN